MTFVAVFDNNVYQGLGPARFDKLLDSEASRGVIALASPVVAQELLARALSTDEDRRRRTRAAIGKLVRHTSAVSESPHSVRFLSSIDAQIYMLLMGERPAAETHALHGFSALLTRIAGASSDDPLDDISEDLERVEAHVHETELRFVSDLGTTSSSIDPRESSEIKRRLSFVESLVRRSGQAYEVTYPEEAIKQHVVTLMGVSESGFALIDAVKAELRARGGGYGQHKNTGWDIEVVLSTSAEMTINGRPVVVVTEERRLLRAAESANARDRIVSLDEYEAKLDSLG